VKTLLEDVPMAVDDAGSGLPVVFLHAFPLHRRMWEPQLAALMHECRCVLPDLRGFGDSVARPPYSMDRYADDIAAVMDMLLIDRAVLCGLSMGGYVALAFWRRHPERVRGLVLADTRATADTAEGAERRRELIGVARSSGAAGVADRQVTGLLGRTTRSKQPELEERVRQIMAANRPEGIIGALEAMLERPDSTPTLATITVPTLVIVGEEDALTPVADARALHQGIAGSRLEVIAGAGHLSNMERPAAFNTVLSEFVGGLLYS
jgi:3-oxoadipate enol-lactonase